MRPGWGGDEPRYWLMAQNLLHGGFADAQTRLFWNGPGYPLTLLPWAAAQAPLWLPRCVNAFWLTLAAFGAWRWFLLLRLPRPRLQVALLSLYLMAHGSLGHRLMSEPLAIALVSLIAWALASACHPQAAASGMGGKSMAWCGFGLALGYLAMTKVFYGYVLLLGFGSAWLGYGILPGRRKWIAPALAMTLALAVCLPYLAYTQAVTGRFPYWGNSGGAQLYGLTLGDERFRGDWLNSDAVIADPGFYGEISAFYAAIDTLGFVAQDDSLKAAALRNIRRHPAKVIRNWRANINRLVLGYPVTDYPGHSPELSTGNRSLIQGLWLYALVSGCLLFLWRRRFPPLGLALPLGFAVVSTFGLTFVSAEPRMVFPLLPIFYGAIAYAWHRGLCQNIDIPTHAG